MNLNDQRRSSSGNRSASIEKRDLESQHKDAMREPIPPFADFIEVICEECGGTGYDFGTPRDFDPDYCGRCCGTGRELVFRNYLAEAFRIVADPKSRIEVCREQIVALATKFNTGLER